MSGILITKQWRNCFEPTHWNVVRVSVILPDFDVILRPIDVYEVKCVRINFAVQRRLAVIDPTTSNANEVEKWRGLEGRVIMSS